MCGGVSVCVCVLGGGGGYEWGFENVNCPYSGEDPAIQSPLPKRKVGDHWGYDTLFD